MSAAEDNRQVLETLAEEIRSLQVDGRNDVNDAAACIFRRLRRLVERTSPKDLDELVGPLREKARMLQFLFGIHEQRKIYRRQAVALLAALLRVPSWREEIDRDACLLAAVPDDVWVALGETQRRTSVSSLGNSDGLVPAGFSEGDCLLDVPDSQIGAIPCPSGHDSDGIAGSSMAGDGGAGTEPPLANSSAPPTSTNTCGRNPQQRATVHIDAHPQTLDNFLSEDTAAARKSAPACEARRPTVRARLLTDDEDVPLRTESSGDKSTLLLTRRNTTLDLLAKGRDKMEALNFEVSDYDLAGEAFDVFYTAVTRITQFATKDHHSHLEDMEPKAMILQFLLQFSAAKPLQKHRVNMVVGQLLQFHSWHQALHSPGFVAKAPLATSGATRPSMPAPAVSQAGAVPPRVVGHPRRELFGFRRKMGPILERCRGCIGLR